MEYLIAAPLYPPSNVPLLLHGTGAVGFVVRRGLQEWEREHTHFYSSLDSNFPPIMNTLSSPRIHTAKASYVCGVGGSGGIRVE